MQDDVAIEATQNRNWQYFVETLLYGCCEGEIGLVLMKIIKKVRSLLTLYKA